MFGLGRFKLRRRRRVRKTTRERSEYMLHKEAARTFVRERIAYWQSVIPVSTNRIAIKDHRSRWGSCSTKGNLNFNYRLVLIPEPLADYVIVHELCHLIEFNHSPRFWNQVRAVMPDFDERKKALHTYAQILNGGLTEPASHVSYRNGHHRINSPY